MSKNFNIEVCLTPALNHIMVSVCELHWHMLASDVVRRILQFYLTVARVAYMHRLPWLRKLFWRYSYNYEHSLYYVYRVNEDGYDDDDDPYILLRHVIMRARVNVSINPSVSFVRDYSETSGYETLNNCEKKRVIYQYTVGDIHILEGEYSKTFTVDYKNAPHIISYPKTARIRRHISIFRAPMCMYEYLYFNKTVADDHPSDIDLYTVLKNNNFHAVDTLYDILNRHNIRETERYNDYRSAHQRFTGQRLPAMIPAECLEYNLGTNNIKLPAGIFTHDYGKKYERYILHRLLMLDTLPDSHGLIEINRTAYNTALNSINCTCLYNENRCYYLSYIFNQTHHISHK